MTKYRKDKDNITDKDDEFGIKLVCVVEDGVTNHKIFVDDVLFLDGLPHSIELTTDDIWDFDLAKCKFYESSEGTMLRVFNVKNKWFIATSKNLNAMKSKWASKYNTFGFSFATAVKLLVDDDIYEEENTGLGNAVFLKKQEESTKYLEHYFEESLDKRHKYVFLIKSTGDERVVCINPKPEIVHIATFDENGKAISENVNFKNVPVAKPKMIEFPNFERSYIASMIDNLDPLKYQGYVAIYEDNGKTIHYKLLNKTHKYYIDLRNNNPNIRLRYLEIRKFFKEDIYKDFINLYDFNDESIAIENEIYKLAEKYHKMYLDRYVEKKNIPDEEIDKIFLDKIHKKYLTSKVQTTCTRIGDLLFDEPPKYLNQLLRHSKKKS